MKRKVLVLIFVLSGLTLNQAVLGQGGSIGISPLTFELSGISGDVIENYIKVYNPSSNDIGVKMQVEDIAPTGELGFVTVEPAETETYSLARWIKTEPTEFQLKPQEEKLVKFTLTVPENAEPGGHYGTVLAAARSIAGEGQVGAAIVQRIGALVLLTVPGEMKENLAIKDFAVPKYSEKGPINFAVRLENKGSIHVKPKGAITITNWFGKKVAEISMPEKNVLPNGIRKYDLAWNKKWLWQGKYTATLTGSYGMRNTQLTSAVITFWVFPWKFGLIILAMLILLILIRKRLISAFKVLLIGDKKR